MTFELRSWSNRIWSHRYEVERLTAPARADSSLGAVVGLQTDARVYAFANEWIWGSQENARAVADQLLQVGELPGGDVR
ncbi:hypothetical protein CVCC1112_2911 [Paenarthrobacter nicotinovorans]|nr:hypothetical protein CVCC1112_2911 [Paenarthrobacter nicotinovorans]